MGVATMILMHGAFLYLLQAVALTSCSSINSQLGSSCGAAVTSCDTDDECPCFLPAAFGVYVPVSWHLQYLREMNNNPGSIVNMVAGGPPRRRHGPSRQDPQVLADMIERWYKEMSKTMARDQFREPYRYSQEENKRNVDEYMRQLDRYFLDFDSRDNMIGVDKVRWLVAQHGRTAAEFIANILDVYNVEMYQEAFKRAQESGARQLHLMLRDALVCEGLMNQDRVEQHTEKIKEYVDIMTDFMNGYASYNQTNSGSRHSSYVQYEEIIEGSKKTGLKAFLTELRPQIRLALEAFEHIKTIAYNRLRMGEEPGLQAYIDIKFQSLVKALRSNREIEVRSILGDDFMGKVISVIESIRRAAEDPSEDVVIEEIVHALEHLMKQLLYDLPQFVRDALPVPTCIKTLDALPEAKFMEYKLDYPDFFMVTAVYYVGYYFGLF